ncbi:hypothetical protein [Cereibacter changlensis]|uniref:hypothetical protein n=1 Tax=Cereibacter changlensis TaxID=402884 RepID=UPI00145DB14E|nr:hypothetical protein [Cereibacter changlensis]
MSLEVTDRKGEPEIYADNRRHLAIERSDQPFRKATARPVLLGSSGRQNFLWRAIADGLIDAQSFQAGLGCLGT